ncbi:MAG: hypothetical protein IIB33_03440 [Chloroflexi bacterium]|nr:hypothetical protein [Chloroflexota bacterium]
MGRVLIRRMTLRQVRQRTGTFYAVAVAEGALLSWERMRWTRWREKVAFQG